MWVALSVRRLWGACLVPRTVSVCRFVWSGVGGRCPWVPALPTSFVALGLRNVANAGSERARGSLQAREASRAAAFGARKKNPSVRGMIPHVQVRLPAVALLLVFFSLLLLLPGDIAKMLWLLASWYFLM